MSGLYNSFPWNTSRERAAVGLMKAKRDPNHDRAHLLTGALIILSLAALTPYVDASSTEPPVPVSEQISHIALFYQPLAAIGKAPPTEAENQRLWHEIERTRDHVAEPDLAGLEKFLTDHPDSAWGPSLHANLGCWDYEHGLYTRALNHWQTAWKATHLETGGPAKAVADFTFAHWTRLLASLGRVETLRELFNETQGRVFDGGPLQQMINSSKEGYRMMMTDPGDCFKCGTYALINLGRQIKGATFPIGPIEEVPSPTNGFSMARVVELGAGVGLELVAARWSTEKVPVVPSIIHWRQDHYAAILEQKGAFYRVADPTFGYQRWIRRSDLAEEATGEFIVPKDRLPAEWETLTDVRYIYDGTRVIQERDGNNVPLVGITRGPDLSGTLGAPAASAGCSLARTATLGAIFPATPIIMPTAAETLRISKRAPRD